MFDQHGSDRPAFELDPGAREDLILSAMVWKSVALELMARHGLHVVSLDAHQVKAACHMVGDYELDESGGVVARRES